MAGLQSILLLLAIVFSIYQIDAYPSGAPKQLCNGSMIPRHGSHTVQPLTTSPLTAFNMTWNTTGETITSKPHRLPSLERTSLLSRTHLVDIQSKEPIKGAFIQARRVNGSEPIGTFLNIPMGMKLVACPTVGHPKRSMCSRTRPTWPFSRVMVSRTVPATAGNKFN